MRKYSLKIDGKDFIVHNEYRQFRVTFFSRMRYTDRLSFLDLAIYNLSRGTAIDQGAEIEFSAGYDEEFDRIFKGKIITVLKERDGANIVTRLLCRSGASDARPSIDVSLGAGATAVQALRACASAWGLALNLDDEQFKDAPVFTRGYSLNGDIPKVLNALASQIGFQWLSTSDTLYVDRNDKPTAGDPREVSLFTGMIGVPEAEGDVKGIFVRVTMRLSPRMRIRTNIELKSEYASYSTGNFYIAPPEGGGKMSGVYKVVEVLHRGDSLGDKWETEIRGQK